MVPMPSAALFWWKATRCSRMAKNATAPHTRDDYEAQAQAWRKIAELLELQETETGQKNRVRHDRRSHFTGWPFFGVNSGRPGGLQRK